MKKTIIYIITKLELGGAQKVCLSLFNELNQENLQTFLISGTEGTLAPSVQHNPRALLTDTLTREISFFRIGRELRNFFTLVKQLRELKSVHGEVIVHTHSTKAGLLGRWAARCAGITCTIHTVHGFAFHPHQPRIIWLAILFLEWITSFITTHYVCVSQADSNTGARYFPGFKHKYSLIRAAVDSKQFLRTPATRTPDLCIVGTIACFKPQKNLFDLLHAFAWAYEHDKKLRLEIIGDGQQRPAIEAWIAHKRLSSVITLHGWQENVAPFMARWHIFALSSLWEGLPCAIIEARLLKLPVITYRVGGIGDVIFHGVNGLVYEPKQWKRIAEGILKLAHDDTLYTTLSYYPDMLENFSYESMLAQHKRLYLDIKNGYSHETL